MHKCNLSAAQLDSLAADLDQLRNVTLSQIGAKDANYIRKIVRIQRLCELGGRVLIMFGLHPIAWLAGVVLLSLSKILDNMEIGHNVLHGQYDFMQDSTLNSKTYDWDIVCDKRSWQRTHNYQHHTYTNVIGKDRDYGYDVLRMSTAEPWRKVHRWQGLKYIVLSLIFEWAVSLHEMNFHAIEQKRASYRDKLPYIKDTLKKWHKQIFKDYVFYPVLALLVAPIFLQTLAANALANIVRNIWACTVIFCGHFPQHTQTFSASCLKDESRGHWYYRQLCGSANFSGSRLLHVLSGHLSFQIEHHLFPDIPAWRYRELAPKVEQIAAKYGIYYNNGSFWQQYKTVLAHIWQHSLPNKPMPSSN